MDDAHLHSQTELSEDFYHNCINVLTHDDGLVHYLRAIVYSFKGGLNADTALNTLMKAHNYVLIERQKNP